MNYEEKAKKFAIKAHRGQLRKIEKNKPMIIHPINVALLLKEFGFDSNVVAAGYLHDVVEDTKYSHDDIINEFNLDIASLVKGASEKDKSLPWEERKKHTINECGKLDLRHKVVVVADKINNLEDLERLMITNPNFSFGAFNSGYDNQKWYYTSLYEKISERESHPIFNRLKEVVNRVFNNEKNLGHKYLEEDKYNKLMEIHHIKYELKKLMNCLNLEPFVIEFTGTPRTGKTSIINNLEDFLKKAGYKVKVLEEFTTSKIYKENLFHKLKKEYKNVVNTEIPKYVNEQLDEELKNDYDIILIDRSLFDRCIWIDRLYLKGGISSEEVEDYYGKYIPLIKEKINLVISTYCDSLISLKRDYECNLSLETRTFLNEKNVNEYNNSLKRTIELFKNNKYEINFYNTNDVSLSNVTYDITKTILLNMKSKIMDEYIKIYGE